MLYILSGKFHKILQSFTMHLGLRNDVKIFIWHSKFQTESQNSLQGALIFITSQYNFLKFGNARKIMSYVSIL